MSIAFAALTAGAHAETINFDREPAGALPPDWTSGVTGRGKPHWSVEADHAAPSPPNVLKQSGAGDFPWCVLKGRSLEDGYVEGVGVWTKADSVTAFDDFTFAPSAPK